MVGQTLRKVRNAHAIWGSGAAVSTELLCVRADSIW